MIYKNIITGAIIDSPCLISGDDWEEVEETTEELENEEVEETTEELENEEVEETTEGKKTKKK
nr:MAG TPA: Pilus-assembly fibrillin subunit, chaperone [Caudoviricetes sp.]